MRIFTLLLLFSLFLLFSNSCKKDIGIESNTNEIIQRQNERLGKVIPNIKVKTFIIGRVLDENGNPLSGVFLRIGDKEVLSDETGEFVFGEINTNKDYTLLKAEKDGYFTGYRTFAPTANSINTVSIALLSKGISKTFNSISGGDLEMDNMNVKLSFNPNSISKLNGDAYNGEVKVYARYLDPDSDNFFDIIQGALIGLDNDNQLGALVSFGMVNVELEDISGNRLQIASGSSVKVGLPANEDDPEEVPTWHFNETYGVWVEAGVGKKDGLQYNFDVNHFSTWNLDVWMNSTNVQIIINDQNGIPVANQHIDLYSADFNRKYKRVYTDQDGKFNLIRSPYDLGLRFLIECGAFSDQTLTINAPTMVVVFNTNHISSLRNLKLQGVVKGCDEATYNEAYFTLTSLTNNKFSFIGKTNSVGEYLVSKSVCDIDLFEEISFVSKLFTTSGDIKIDTFKVVFSSDDIEIDLKFCNSAIDPNDFVITFEDINFENAVRARVGKPELPILKSDVEKITLLNINSKNVSNLSGIQYFTNLNALYMNSNQISNLNLISNLEKLKTIEFKFNNVSNLTPLQSLIKIEWMQLTDNNVSDISYISNLTSIKNLGLSKNQIEDIDPLGFLINLERLDLSENNITSLNALCNLGTSFTGTIIIKDNNPAFTTQQKNELISCLPNAIIQF